MKKAGILAMLLCCAPALLAQQPQQPPAPPEQWAAVTCYVPTQATQPQTSQPPAATQLPKRPHPLDPADVETLAGRPYEGGSWGKAPKPGHPLDWTDVEILTGRGRSSSNGYSGSAYRATPYVYVPMDGQMYGSMSGYGSRYGSRFGGNVFSPITTFTRPLFAPRVFRRLATNSGFFFFR